ncbi:hypothetical protein BJ546DRAFT_1113724 [Cryomyces antarcticus]
MSRLSLCLSSPLSLSARRAVCNTTGARPLLHSFSPPSSSSSSSLVSSAAVSVSGRDGQHHALRTQTDETLLAHPSAAAAEGAGSKLSSRRADADLLSAAGAAAASQDVKTGIEAAKRGGEEGMSEVPFEHRRFSPLWRRADAYVPHPPPPSPASASSLADTTQRGSGGEGEGQDDAHGLAKAAEEAGAVRDKKRVDGNDKNRGEDEDDDDDEEGKGDPPGPPSGAGRGARWFDAWFGGKAHWMDVGDFRAAPYT